MSSQEEPCRTAVALRHMGQLAQWDKAKGTLEPLLEKRVKLSCNGSEKSNSARMAYALE